MKKVIFIMLIACMAGSAYAQSKSDSSSSVRKNELMLSLNTLHAYSSIPGGILYRRNFKNISLRVGLNGNYQNALRGSSGRLENYSIASTLGIQKNIRLTDRFDMYWGGDLSYTYRNNFYKDSTYERTSDVNSIGISPFVGIRYSYKRLVLGVETSGNFSYNIDRQRETPYGSFTSPANFDQRSMNFNLINSTKFLIGIKF